MRTPFVWTRPSQTSLCALCACCALWGAPAAVLAAPERITPTTMPAASTAAPAAASSLANDPMARIGRVLFDRRVLALLAMGCLIGLLARWVSGGPPEIRFRLLNKPKKTPLSVLVPPGPAPRLVPGDSPNATRARAARVPVPRQAPVGAARSGLVDYIAAFSDSAEGNAGVRVDYLLVSDDSEEEPSDPQDGSDDSLRDRE
jgi:hypothetical protein